MLQFEMKQSEFIDMIQKMSIPNKSRKTPFFFPTVELTIRPDNEIEWIGKFQHIIAWIRVKCQITGILEPVQVPIYAPKFLKLLKAFKSGDTICFTHYPEKEFDSLTRENKGKIKSSRLVEISKSDIPVVEGMLKEFPFRLEKEGPDIIMFQNGLIRPNISGTCDVKIFKDLAKHAIAYKKGRIHKLSDNSLVKKIKNEPLMYNIFIDDTIHVIKTVAGYENKKHSIVDSNLITSVSGHGELHYSSGFAEVINLLSGEITFYAVDNGPLWITQDTDQMKLRYLIAPSPIYTY